jgi:hypothetical protein
MKHIKLFEQFIEAELNESTINNFKPEVLKKSNSLDEKLFKKLMPKTANTTDEAMEWIWDFEGETMFVHYQYFEVKPNGNADDRPTYRIHNSQYWLNDTQLALQGKRGEEVDVTKLTVTDITDRSKEKSLGQIYVRTKVFLDELKRVFEVIKSAS